ncbi:MAG: bluetail domain-containing putative surface protein [Methylococcaceae bacterium]
MSVGTLNVVMAGLTTKFLVSTIKAAILTTADAKTFIAIDSDASGTFTTTDYLIEITGSTLTSVTTATFI